MGNYFDAGTYWSLYNFLNDELGAETANTFAGFFTNQYGNFYVIDENAYVAWVMELVDDDMGDAAQFFNWSHTQPGLSTQYGYGPM